MSWVRRAMVMKDFHQLVYVHLFSIYGGGLTPISRSEHLCLISAVGLGYLHTVLIDQGKHSSTKYVSKTGFDSGKMIPTIQQSHEKDVSFLRAV